MLDSNSSDLVVRRQTCNDFDSRSSLEGKASIFSQVFLVLLHQIRRVGCFEQLIGKTEHMLAFICVQNSCFVKKC